MGPYRRKGVAMTSARLSGGILCAVLVVSACAVGAQELLPKNRFIRGDVNCDGCVNWLDIEDLLGYMFAGEPSNPLCCEKAADANGDGQINVSDSNFIAAFLRQAGPVPVAPGGLQCGFESDGVQDELTCENYDESVCGRNCDVGPFLRGDCNGDGEVEGITDAVFLLALNFLGGVRVPCLAACDATGDGDTSGTTDAIYILTYFFLGTEPPLAPFPRCGVSAHLPDRLSFCKKPLRGICPVRVEDPFEPIDAR